MTSPSLEPGLPLVTAVGLCYNHEQYVRDCLEGIKRQTYPNLEIIIADDCSRDSSPLLIQEWIKQNPSLPVTFVRNEQNRGVCATLNRVLTLARGKYISMTATDDIWEPGKILEQVRAMESLPETMGVLYSDAYLMDEAGKPLSKRFIETYRRFDHMPDGDIHALLWEGNFIPAMTTFIRRSVFDKVGWYDEELSYEDWDMWLRISEHYHFAYFPRPTARYRVSMYSMSKTSVDKMTLADELIFIKFLLRKRVPKQVRNQAFNFAVRRAYRQKAATPTESKQLLNTLLRLYKSPRLLYAWMLYVLGFEYRHYESTIRAIKKIAQPAR